jgi:hypothetical protein
VKLKVRSPKCEAPNCGDWREAIRLQVLGESEPARSSVTEMADAHGGRARSPLRAVLAWCGSKRGVFERGLRRATECAPYPEGLRPSRPHIESLQGHLATCEGCRRYAEELQAVAASLRRLANQPVQPSPGLRARWTQAVEDAAAPFSIGEGVTALVTRFAGFLQENLRPALAVGLLWVLTVLFRVSAPNVSTATQTATARSPIEIVRALQESEQLMAEAPRQAGPAVLTPQKAPSTPPRSEGPSGAPSAFREGERQRPLAARPTPRRGVAAPHEHPSLPFEV